MQEINEAALKDVLRYWQALGEYGGLPKATAVDPLDLRAHLGRLSIVETAPRLEDFRIRLFGTQLTAEFRQERTGARFGDLSSVENWELVFTPYLTVCDTRLPHYQALRPVSGLRAYRGYARLLLPLAGEDLTVQRILCAFAFSSARPG